MVLSPVAEGEDVFVRLFLLASVLVTALVQGAQAGSFEDFNQGLEAHNRGDIDAEIAAFSRALAAGNLLESLKPAAFYDRGVAYLQKKRYADAIADLTAVIQQKPNDLDALRARANSYQASGNFRAARSDCDALILLRPRSASLLGWCGRLAFAAAQYDDASSYLKLALKLGDEDHNAPYDLLWLALASLKSGKAAASEMNGWLASADDDQWPSPLVKYFLGQIPENVVRTAASTGDSTSQQDRSCEMDFYLGEWKMAHQNTSDAKALLQQAANLCPNNYIERDAAKAELGTLPQIVRP